MLVSGPEHVLPPAISFLHSEIQDPQATTQLFWDGRIHHPQSSSAPLGLSVTQPKRVIRSNFPVGQLCLSSEIQTTCTIKLWIFAKMLIFRNVNIKSEANCLTNACLLCPPLSMSEWDRPHDSCLSLQLYSRGIIRALQCLGHVTSETKQF